MQSFMNQALIEAIKAFDSSEVPVGAAIVHNNEIIAKAHNNQIINSDSLAHAEILAMRAASERLGSRYLTECDIYVTLEPCPMCAHAISLMRCRALYFGAYDPKSGGVENGPRIYTHGSAHHKPSYYGGIEEDSCKNLIKQFFKQRRFLENAII